ncbi:MAG: hypothetical protein H7Z37_18470 [Pyrinomonadaceae bacterium]|nr:hypothetical protein [Pyrinomonadaceae bacterium]
MKNTLIRAVFLLMFMAIIENSFVISAQKRVVPVRAKTDLIQVKPENAARINLETTALPKGFTGHDAAVLFKNLKTLTMRNKASIKNKTVYGDLTTSDYFVFGSPASRVQGIMAINNAGLQYEGDLWRVRAANDFPEPRAVYVEGCGSGSGIGLGKPPLVSSRDKLAVPLEQSTDVWRESVFDLSKELPKTQRTDYKGYNVGKQCREFYVPLQQTHYGLSFVKAQPLKLVQITDNKYETYHGRAFSLDSYGYETENGFGFAVWNGGDVVPQEKRKLYLSTLFVVKLAAPYISTKTFTKLDKVENKTHTAIQNKIYADIVGVWLYDGATGEIISKQTTDKP